MGFDKKVFVGLLVQGDLRGGVAYLAQFPEQKDTLARYREIFEEDKSPVLCDDPVISKLLTPFQRYYREVFWLQTPQEEATDTLISALAGLARLSHKLPNGSFQARRDFFDDEVEPALQAMAEKAGYHYLGGDTQGYLGPYIWKHEERHTFPVELPDETAEVTVDLLRGFVSLSWGHYISLGISGPGGWAGADGVMRCVIDRYEGGVESEDFQVHFLKHEAQHLADYRRFPGLSSAELEYRAKLVELIYGEPGFLDTLRTQASGADEQNSHAYSAWRIVRDFAQTLWSADDQADPARWQSAREKAAQTALSLYRADTARLEEARRG